MRSTKPGGGCRRAQSSGRSPEPPGTCLGVTEATLAAQEWGTRSMGSLLARFSLATLPALIHGDLARVFRQRYIEPRKSWRKEATMLLQLSIVPLGRGRSISPDLADVVKIIQASGLDYRVTATATILEGDWDQLMNVTKQCHLKMREKTERVLTFMKIDDYADRAHRITRAVEAIEQAVGQPVKK
ncbi:MAG TPA: MTH1187 family thiamine-binding protein [Candidatus Acidoferrales bacterium]